MIAAAKMPDLKSLGMSDVLVDLLHKVLAKDPTNRAGVGDCLQHQFCAAAREQRIRELGDEVEKQDENIVIPRRHDLQQVRLSDRMHASAYLTITYTHAFTFFALGAICNKAVFCARYRI